MDIFEKFAEMVVNFVRKYVVKFIVNQVLDWLWKKIKPKLLKIGRKLWQKSNVKLCTLCTMQVKPSKLKQRKRTNDYNALVLILIIIIMITMIPKHMIIIIVIS